MSAVTCIFISLLQVSCTVQLQQLVNDAPESIENCNLRVHVNCLQIDQLGISWYQLNIKPPESFFILGKDNRYWAEIHRILSRPAAETSVIVVRDVSYPHFTQLNIEHTAEHIEFLLLSCNETTQYPLAVFLDREELYINRWNLPQCEQEWKNHLYINQSSNVTLRWSKWCQWEFSLFDCIAISILGHILRLSGWGGQKDGTTCLIKQLVN